MWMRACEGVELDADVVRILDGRMPTGAGWATNTEEFINQLRVYGLLAMYLLDVRGGPRPDRERLSTTTMLDKLGRSYRRAGYHTGVGLECSRRTMMQPNALIGGETSGFAFRGHVPERDGILAGLYLLGS